MCGAAAFGLAWRAEYPAAWYAPAHARRALAKSTWIEFLDAADVRARMRAEFDFEGPPRRALGRTWWRLDEDSVLPFESHELDRHESAALRDLRDGDLVVARHSRAQAYGTSLALAEFTWFNHMGLVAIEDGRVVIYESWATLSRLGPSQDFASRFQGGARRTPLVEFLREYEELSFLRLTDAERGGAWAEAARNSLERGIRFDPHHDPNNAELDCSEYVLALAQEIGLALDPPRVASTPNPAVRALQQSLGFHDREYVVPDAFFSLPAAQGVTRLSRHPSLERSFVAREAARLLQGLVGQSGQASDLLAFDRWRLLRLRRNARSFLDWADAYFAAHPGPDLALLHSKLRQMLPIFFRGSPSRGSELPRLDVSLPPWHGSGNTEGPPAIQ